MPTSVVKTPKDEKRWNKARSLAAKAGKGENYAYVMGIYQRMMEKSAYTGPGTRVGSPGNYDYKYTQSSKRTFKVGDESKIGGIKLSGKGSQWVFVHKSSKNPGMWQASFFDQATPVPGQAVPDSQHRSAQDAVDAALEMGYEAVNVMEKATFGFAVAGAKIFKAVGDPYQGPGRREGTPGNYTYIYDDNGGPGKKPGKTEETEEKEAKPSLEDQKKEAEESQEVKQLKGMITRGLLSQARRFLSIMAPGAGELVGPLSSLHDAKTASDRKKYKAEIDGIREKIKEKKSDTAAQDRAMKMTDKQIESNLDRLENRPGLDKKAEAKERDVLEAEQKRRAGGAKEKESSE